MPNESITQERLKELLHYNPLTGIFIRLTKPSNNRNIGDIAGGRDGVYMTISLDGVKYKSHRLAWLYVYGVWPRDQIDHENHDKLDNKILNLKEATNKTNGMNQSKKSNNTSGITGVSWYKRNNQWQSYISVNGKITSLGRFNDFFEACCARLSAKSKYGFHENHGK